jgi:hypothetical protein
MNHPQVRIYKLKEVIPTYERVDKKQSKRLTVFERNNGSPILSSKQSPVKIGGNSPEFVLPTLNLEKKSPDNKSNIISKINPENRKIIKIKNVSPKILARSVEVENINSMMDKKYGLETDKNSEETKKKFFYSDKGKDLNDLNMYNSFEKKIKVSPSKTTHSTNIISDSTDYIKQNKKLIKTFNCLSKPGRNEEGLLKTNQDSYIDISRVFDLDNYHIFGVMDGHGSNGHFVSSLVQKFFHEFFNNINNYNVPFLKSSPLSSDKNKKGKFLKNLDSSLIKEDYIYEKIKEQNYELLKFAFKEADSSLSNSSFEVNFSGTTCVIILFVNNKLICANVGDSRAIMVSNSKSVFDSGTKHSIICN